MLTSTNLQRYGHKGIILSSSSELTSPSQKFIIDIIDEEHEVGLFNIIPLSRPTG